MFDAAPEPRQIELVDSRHHGSALVTNADPIADQMRRIIVAFIEEHV